MGSSAPAPPCPHPPIPCRSGAGEPRAGGSPRAAMHCHPRRAIHAWGAWGDPAPQAQTPTPLGPPTGTEQPWELLPTRSTRLGGWDLPSGCPWCGGSRQCIPAGEEGSSRAAPNGLSKVSCLPEESSAPPALVSIRHCPALEVICCFINYLHTMGPLSAPEQHTFSIQIKRPDFRPPRPNKVPVCCIPTAQPRTHSHLAPHQPRPRPPPTSGHEVLVTLPCGTHAVGITGLDSHPGCLGVPSPRHMADPSCMPIPHGQHGAP